LNKRLHQLLGALKPKFTKKEIKIISTSQYWKDKTNHLIEKYTKVIKAFRTAFLKERKENFVVLNQLKNVQKFR